MGVSEFPMRSGADGERLFGPHLADDLADQFHALAPVEDLLRLASGRQARVGSANMSAGACVRRDRERTGKVRIADNG